MNESLPAWVKELSNVLVYEDDQLTEDSVIRKILQHRSETGHWPGSMSMGPGSLADYFARVHPLRRFGVEPEQTRDSSKIQFHVGGRTLDVLLSPELPPRGVVVFGPILAWNISTAAEAV